MATFDKNHEKKVAAQILGYAASEAQMTEEHLKNDGPTFSSDRAKFLIRVLVQSAAHGLVYVEGITHMDLSKHFADLFASELEESRKILGIEL